MEVLALRPDVAERGWGSIPVAEQEELLGWYRARTFTGKKKSTPPSGPKGARGAAEKRQASKRKKRRG